MNAKKVQFGFAILLLVNCLIAFSPENGAKAENSINVTLEFVSDAYTQKDKLVAKLKVYNNTKEDVIFFFNPKDILNDPGLDFDLPSTILKQKPYISGPRTIDHHIPAHTLEPGEVYTVDLDLTQAFDIIGIGKLVLPYTFKLRYGYYKRSEPEQQPKTFEGTLKCTIK